MGGKSNKGRSRGGKANSKCKSNNSRAGVSSSAASSGASSKNTAPTGDSLTLELVGSPAALDLTKDDSFPATAVVGSEEGKLSINLPSWDALDSIIAWFRDASDKDHEASLTFSSSLAKQHRAKIHSAASAVGLGALVSLSRGVGEDRRITLARRGSAVAKEAAEAAANEDPVLAAKAVLLYQWAKIDNVEVSRDEAVEIMANNGGDNMPEALATVWAAHWPLQEAAERLCTAIANGDITEVNAAIEAAPKEAITQGRIIDERTGVAPLHFAAGEGNVALVEILLSAGFPAHCSDGAGATALDIAKKYEHSDVQGVLLRAGAVDTEVVPTISESNSTNGTHIAEIETATTAAHGNLSSAAPATDSVISVCGTETGADKAADISSVVGDFIDTEYSENGGTAAAPTGAAALASSNSTASSDGAVSIVGVDVVEQRSKKDVSEEEENTKTSTTSKHGKFAVSVPAVVSDATAAVAAYGKKALEESKAASTKAIENTKSVTLSYGHKAIDGGKAAVESSKAYTIKALESGKTAVSHVAEKADENVKVAVSWVKAHSVYLLAGAGAVVATAGVVLAVTHRNGRTARY